MLRWRLTPVLKPDITSARTVYANHKALTDVPSLLSSIWVEGSRRSESFGQQSHLKTATIIDLPREVVLLLG